MQVVIFPVLLLVVISWEIWRNNHDLQPKSKYARTLVILASVIRWTNRVWPTILILYIVFDSDVLWYLKIILLVAIPIGFVLVVIGNGILMLKAERQIFRDALGRAVRITDRK